jgi:hypothetical protein
MDKSEYRKKQEAAEHKRQESADNAYRNEVISALERRGNNAELSLRCPFRVNFDQTGSSAPCPLSPR